LRYCNGTSGYHVDEDQVNDIERTGIPERIGFFLMPMKNLVI